MIGFCLLLTTLLPVISIHMTGYYADETQWLIYDIVGRTSYMAACLALFLLVPYKRTLIKVEALLAFLCSIWWAVDYTLLTWVDDSILLRNISDFIFLALAVPATFNILFRPYDSTDSYSSVGIFSVYRRPRNIWGALAALITNPYGSRSIVKNGVEFIYKDSTLIGRTYKPLKSHIYEKIEDVNIEKYLGRRWSLFNNCFRLCRNGK